MYHLFLVCLRILHRQLWTIFYPLLTHRPSLLIAQAVCSLLPFKALITYAADDILKFIHLLLLLLLLVVVVVLCI